MSDTSSNSSWAAFFYLSGTLPRLLQSLCTWKVHQHILRAFYYDHATGRGHLRNNVPGRTRLAPAISTHTKLGITFITTYLA